MTEQNSATLRRGVSLPAQGTLAASAGVAAFSLSFPATVWALRGFGPWTAAGLRGVLAALIAGGALAAYRARRPARDELPGLLVVALGCVIGFPLLTALALQTASTAHSAVVIGLLPIATAAISTLRGHQRPPPLFWVAAGVGAAAVATFTLTQSQGRPTLSDAFLAVALLVCAAGYAEGGRLAGRLPSWHVIAWGVVLAAPVNLVVTAIALPAEPVHADPIALLGLLYVAGISQFGGFVVWYGGMARIGVARASQIQLAQPLLTLIWASLLMGETLTIAAPATALVVLACILVTQRARDDRPR
jgi:drug/metabolite transporter (DMT)-like permease